MNRFWIGLALAAASSAAAPAAELRVSAAASLINVLQDTAAAYEKAHAVRVQFNFGGSNLLARQIEEGAPADLFISADEAKMDQLSARGAIVTGTRRDLFSNALAIIVSSRDPFPLRRPEDLRKAKRIALADPRAVPAGIYAKAYLEKVKLWPELEGKVIPCQNVRAALAAVESGDADAGIVYRTDAAISTRARVAFEVPLNEGPVIRYPAAVVRGAQNPRAAEDFLRYLTGETAGAIFRRAGFIVLRKKRAPE